MVIYEKLESPVQGIAKRDGTRRGTYVVSTDGSGLDQLFLTLSKSAIFEFSGGVGVLCQPNFGHSVQIFYFWNFFLGGGVLCQPKSPQI